MPVEEKWQINRLLVPFKEILMLIKKNKKNKNNSELFYRQVKTEISLKKEKLIFM